MTPRRAILARIGNRDLSVIDLMVRLAGVEPATLGLEVGGNSSTLDLAAGRLSRRTTQSTGPVLVQAGRLVRALTVG